MAEHKFLNLTISRVDGPVFDGEVVSVNVPGVAGAMTVMANHEALISPLKTGIITVTLPEGKENYEIESGTLEVSNNHATILI